MEKKSNVGLYIIIVILCIVLTVAICFIIFKKDNKASNQDSTNQTNVSASEEDNQNKQQEQQTTTNSNQNNVISDDSTKSVVGNDSNNISNSNKVYSINKEFNIDDVINTNEFNNRFTYKVTDEVKDQPYITLTKTNDSIIKITIDWKNYTESYGYDNLNYVPNEFDGKYATYILNFSKKVLETRFFSNNQGIGGQAYLFLMEDGTINYMFIEEAIENNNFKIQGTLPDIQNIVKLYTVDCISPYNGSHNDVWAQRNDGKMYILYDKLTSIYMNN